MTITSNLYRITLHLSLIISHNINGLFLKLRKFFKVSNFDVKVYIDIIYTAFQILVNNTTVHEILRT